jgi:hypothetical protein
MARYKMTVVFDVHEEVQMKYIYRHGMDKDKADMGASAYIALKGVERYPDEEEHPHINKLYDDVVERIEPSLKHPITYDILSFEKLKEG